MDNNEKKLEIIEGDGSNINMSPVLDYIVPVKSKKDKAKKLIVPTEKNTKKKK